MWLAEDNPVTMQVLEKMPIVEYWHLLNRKIAAAEKAERKIKDFKKGRRGGNTR